MVVFFAVVAPLLLLLVLCASRVNTGGFYKQTGLEVCCGFQ
jgi:hypothetical protein